MRARAGLGVAFLLLAFPPAQSAGPVYHVNSIVDAPDAAIDGVCETGHLNGICTLRAAVMEANLGPNPQAEEVTIELPAGTYLLTRPIGVPDDHSNGDLNLTGPIRIVGVGIDLSIIDGNHVDRAIFVAPSAVVTLSDLRVQGGRPPDSSGRTGAGKGGGIYSEGSLHLLRCLVRDNLTAGSNAGGGLFAQSGSLAIDDSAIRVNGAPNGPGGGIYSLAATAISRSSVYSNGGTFGGALLQSGGSLKIENSSVSGNSASGNGAGLYLFHVTGVTLNNATLSGNIVSGVGGGIGFESATVTLANSVLANVNSVGGDDDLGNCGGSTITSNGFNLVRAPGSCTILGASSTAEPLLGALAYNGGPTATSLPMPGSPAIGAGNPAGCLDAIGAPLPTDQRGVKRLIGARCDLGALEVEPVGDANGDGLVTVSDVFWLINYLFAGGAAPLGRANVNGGNGTIDVTDVFYLINFLFAGGAAPV